MRAKRTTPLISWALGLLTLIALLLNLPDINTNPETLGLWLLFLLLTAFSLNMGVLLSSGEISPAHLFSIMAFLTLGRNGRAPEALWAVAMGALLGGLIQVARSDQWLPRRRVTARSLATVAETTAQLTLSLLVGEALYVQMDGSLPLGYMEPKDVLPLVVFSVGYVTFYLLFIVLRVRLDGKAISSVLAADWMILGGVVLLPVPFGILGAVVANDLDQLSWTILIGGLVLVVIGVYGLSRTQFYYRQQVQEMSSLSVVSQALRSNLELDVLLDTIYRQVSALLKVDTFIVAMLDSQLQKVHFPLAIEQGRHIELSPRDLDNSLLDHVITGRQPLLIEQQVPQRAAAMNLKPPAETVYSWMGVPLLAQERALGAIAVASSDPEHLLSAADQRLLMNIAAQAGVAIENAQLYGEAQDRALQLATLNSISALLTGTLSPERVINLIASSVVAVANCDAVALYLYWDSRLSLTRNVGMSVAFSDKPPVPLISLMEPQQAGQHPVVVTDAHSDPRVDRPLCLLADREGKRSWIELMLMSGEEPQGVIVAYYNQPRTFSSDEIELMRTFTVQAALAVSNARLYTTTDIALDRRVNQLQALYDIGQELTSTLNLQKIFDRLVDRALEGTRGDSGLVGTGVEDGVGIQAAAHRGYPPGTFDNRPVLRSGVIPTAYDSGQPIMIRDIRQYPAYHTPNPATRSLLCVPIRREHETLGVIAVESALPDAFGEDDITFVTQLATQAAIAIENARLFKRIAEGRDRLQVILDSMTEGVVLIARDGTVALVNPRVETLLGVRPLLMIGRQLEDTLIDTGAIFARRLGFTSGELRILVADLRAGHLDPVSGEYYSYEIEEPHHVFVSRSIATVQDESGTLLGLLLVYADETEQQELANAREDLSRMIVHDLRGPLTAVTASLKLLNDLVPENSDFTPIVQRTTEASMRAVRKLLNLVDSLLDIAKMESGQLRLESKPIHLNTITDNMIMEMESLARELDVNLHIAIPDDLPLLEVDGDQVERVMVNLVDNALKFTPTDGLVLITAYPPGERDTPEGFARVEVRDTGPGIPDEYKERLFNRFVQIEGIHGRRRGTGLGLAFCRLAVESHGGHIWIEDNPDGGSIFAFTLPVSQSAGQEEAEADLREGETEGPLL